MECADEEAVATAGNVLALTINPVPLQTFVRLSHLMGGDPLRVLSILRAFRDTARDDLDRLDEAVIARDATRIREMAHRMASACHLLGESDAGRQLDAIAESSEFRGILRSIDAMRVAHARTALSASITRVTILIDVAEAGPYDGPASRIRMATRT